MRGGYNHIAPSPGGRQAGTVTSSVTALKATEETRVGCPGSCQALTPRESRDGDQAKIPLPPMRLSQEQPEVPGKRTWDLPRQPVSDPAPTGEALPTQDPALTEA